MSGTQTISVIIPIYSASSTLLRCLNSLKCQSFPDFEAILVDDGSTDDSGRIEDDYSTKDARFYVIHKANAGVSSARQCGLNNASGDYVIHLDPDDWVEPGMLEALLKKTKYENADMVICDYFENVEGQCKYVKQQPSSLEHEIVLHELFQQLHGSCCNKLVRRACYNKFNISFPDKLSFSEDTYVNALLLQEEIKITYLARAFYHYCVTATGLCHKRIDWIHEQQILLLQALRSSLRHKYHQRCLAGLENDIAIGTLTLENLTEFDQLALKNFSCAFPNLKKSYWEIPCPLRRRLLFLLSFIGIQHIVRSLLLRLKRR